MKHTVYNLLYFLFRIIRGVFFREVEVVGLENVPTDGPVILVGTFCCMLCELWNTNQRLSFYYSYIFVTCSCTKQQLKSKMLGIL